MPITTVWAWDAAYLEAVLAPYQRVARSGPGGGLVHALGRERSALGMPVAARRLDHVERVVLAWAAAAWWRMAPWRHDNVQWRDWVEQRVVVAKRR